MGEKQFSKRQDYSGRCYLIVYWLGKIINSGIGYIVFEKKKISTKENKMQTGKNDEKKIVLFCFLI